MLLQRVFTAQKNVPKIPGSDPDGQSEEVIYFQFPDLSRHKPLAHGIFTRLGGVSAAPYDTLNTSYQTEDPSENVGKNLRILSDVIGSERLIFMDQVHGEEVIVLRRGHGPGCAEALSGDALISDVPGLALMVKVADCQGVILFDPIKGVVSNVHCGWRGNTSNILGSVVKRMGLEFGSEARDLVAAIGPSLGPCCAEFVTHEQIFPWQFSRFMVRENYFDLWEISRWQLLEAGVRDEHIEVAGMCTSCRTDLFFSYRGEGVTGRFATVAMLH